VPGEALRGASAYITPRFHPFSPDLFLMLFDNFPQRCDLLSKLLIPFHLAQVGERCQERVKKSNFGPLSTI
jgi:hypothetical protein